VEIDDVTLKKKWICCWCRSVHQKYRALGFQTHCGSAWKVAEQFSDRDSDCSVPAG